MNIDTQVFDPYYGDYLNINEIKHLSYNLFPDVFCGDIALEIIQCMDFTTLGKLGKLSQSWNKVSNHTFAEKRVILYKQMFNPEDWNHYSKQLLIALEEMKEAFKSLPPTINEHSSSISLKEYAIAYLPKNISINKVLTLFGVIGHITTVGSSGIFEKYGKYENGRARFVAVKRNLLPESSGKSFIKKQEMMKVFNATVARIHRVPALLEMLALIGTEKIKFETDLLGHAYTRCQETYTYYDDGSDSSVAAGYDGTSINICCPRTNSSGLGLALVIDIT